MNATPPAHCSPAPLFAAMRAASGGRNWERLGETLATGVTATSGLRGSASFATDLSNGRSAQRFAIHVMGAFAQVYDGQTLWQQDISGGVHARDSAFPRALAITDSFIARRGFDNPPRGTQMTCLGTRVEEGRTVSVVRVQPPGGIPAELSIDGRSHLLARITERYPIETEITQFDDYRSVAGLVLPFHVTQGSTFEPKDGYDVTFLRYTVRPEARALDFAQPVARNDVSMRNEAHATTVPLTVESRELLVPVSIDGHAPMPFVLDTGGHAILTSLAAKALGLHGSGAGESGGSGAGTVGLQFARVRSVRIGAARIEDQPFLVIPYPPSFYARGRHEPIAGIIGLEIFERFAVRIDVAGHAASFTPLGTYAHRGSGPRVPFSFQDDMPMTTAAADGSSGLFGIDTGNSGSLILFGGFLRRTGIPAHYPGGIAAVGQGTGGANAVRIQMLHRFALGRYAFHNVRTAFTDMRTGSFSSWTEAGNLGVNILEHFTPTFDYKTESLFLDPREDPAKARKSVLNLSLGDDQRR